MLTRPNIFNYAKRVVAGRSDMLALNVVIRMMINTDR